MGYRYWGYQGCYVELRESAVTPVTRVIWVTVTRVVSVTECTMATEAKNYEFWRFAVINITRVSMIIRENVGGSQS